MIEVELREIIETAEVTQNCHLPMVAVTPALHTHNFTTTILIIGHLRT
jgi:hypothetical protein